MAFTATIHVQTAVAPEHLATIANGLTALGCNPRSMSDLVATALEMLADVLVENGHKAVVEPQLIGEVLGSIGHGRRRRPKLAVSSPLVVMDKEEKTDPFGAIALAQAKAIHASGRYRRALGTQSVPFVYSGDEIEVLPSVADDGEFSADGLRNEERD